MDLTAQIQIEKVYPRNGTKPPSVRDTGGNYFGITDGSVGMFQPGTTGTITYWVKQGENRQFFNATKWNGIDLPKGQAAPAATPLYVPQKPSPAAPTNTIQSNEDKEEGMFVMGVVGRSMQSGQFSFNDIDALTKAAVAAWRNRHSAQSNGGIPQEPFVNRTEGGMPDHINDPNYMAAG